MTEQSIQRLEQRVINQIAAGEVIESSASVVKELVENALDAKSTEISIETGPDFIKVVDNGSGMSDKDLFLSIERHATSKISEIEDLNNLNSLGFRGEALASIASISKITLITSQGDFGHFLEAEGSKISHFGTRARRKGTTVEVRSLFYNVPVRKKFQKSKGAQKAEIHKALTYLTLCNPHVRFDWTHEGKLIFSLNQEALFEKARELLGEELASSFFPFDFQNGLFGLKGYLSQPHFHKPNRSGQFLFINGRSVDSPFISRQVNEGYATRLPSGRFPCFIFYLNVPLPAVDVNVHPQKKEVRFLDEEKMGAFIIEAIHKALQKKEKPSAPISIKLPALEKMAPLSESSAVEWMEKPEREPTLFRTYFQPLAKVGKFLLIEKENQILMVDLKEARKRLIVELLNEKKEKGVQTLLIPLNIEFSKGERFLVLENLEKLNKIGIAIRPFGEKTFVVDAIPDCLDLEEVELVIRSFIEKDFEMKKKGFNREIRSFEEGVEIVERLLHLGLFESLFQPLTEKGIETIYESN